MVMLQLIPESSVRTWKLLDANTVLKY